MTKFHIFAREIEGNMGDTSAERERIEVATDASLDEGAILRTTGAGASPLAGPTGYFLGLDGAEAKCVRIALDRLHDLSPDVFENYFGKSVLARVEKMLGYINSDDEAPQEEGASSVPKCANCGQPLYAHGACQTCPYGHPGSWRAPDADTSAQDASLAVYDVESFDPPQFIGWYVSTDEDVIRYRRSDGTVGSAPVDCVEVRTDHSTPITLTADEEDALADLMCDPELFVRDDDGGWVDQDAWETLKPLDARLRARWQQRRKQNPPRTVLVHLNLEVEHDDPRDADAIADEIIDATRAAGIRANAALAEDI